MKLPLSRIAEFVSASGSYDGNVIAQRYSIDSRTIQPGDLFFAVKGERLDGHDFVEQALSKGAIAAVLGQNQLGGDLVKTPPLPGGDTLVALQTLSPAPRPFVGQPRIRNTRA